MRPQDWAFLAALAAAVSTVVTAVQGRWPVAIGLAALTAALDRWSHALSRKHHGPMPAFFRWGLLWPRNLLDAAHLIRLLAPRPGERIFELGPGVGVHALPVAAALSPSGTLHVLDAQAKMLDHLARRAARAGVANLEATLADGRTLPYPASSFDGAYLIDVLGELPDARAALGELRRILKPDGRLVVGEHFLDPDFVSLRALEAVARDSGFALESRRGIRLIYLARFKVVTQ
jgi:SAM-dependent methyltransferase